MAVIAIPLAFRRTASRAVEATNGPAVQSLTWTPLHRPIFCWEKIETEPPVDSDFLENRNAHLYRLGREIGAGNGSIR